MDNLWAINDKFVWLHAVDKSLRLFVELVLIYPNSVIPHARFSSFLHFIVRNQNITNYENH